MKTVLIILFAFLFKVEAGAQTWRKISPEGVNFFGGVKVLKDDNDKVNIIAFGHFQENIEINQHFFYYKEGSKWVHTLPVFAGYCFYAPGKWDDDPKKVPAYYSFGDMILAEDIVYINSGMYCSGVANQYVDEKGELLPKSYNSYRYKIALDTFKYFQANYAALDTVFHVDSPLLYSHKNKLFYTLASRQLKYSDSVKSITDSNSFKLHDFYDEMMPLALKIDERKISTVYLLTGLQVYQSVNNGKDWTYLYQYNEDPDDFLYFDLAFPPNHENIILAGTTEGILRYNSDSKQSDTVLKISSPIKKIIFKEYSDIAFAYTDSGTIYRTLNAGETWSLFASGVFSKPIIELFPVSSDSLIVGTEDGIWANYGLPVSVTEEIPFNNDELTITPNPANTSLKISFLKTDVPQQLLIYNSLGQIVFKTEFSGEFVWDFKNDVPDGIYTVAVQFGGQSVAKQVVILK